VKYYSFYRYKFKLFIDLKLMLSLLIIFKLLLKTIENPHLHLIMVQH